MKNEMYSSRESVLIAAILSSKKYLGNTLISKASTFSGFDNNTF